MENMGSKTKAEQITITQNIMEILDGWGLSSAHMISVLALPEKTPGRAFRKYRENTPFPLSSEVEQRVEHIGGIAEALRTSYPHNPQMGNIWIRQASKKLNNRIPLELIVEGGLSGIVEIRKHLDCTFDWYNQP